jgi:hypothetical protein
VEQLLLYTRIFENMSQKYSNSYTLKPSLQAIHRNTFVTIIPEFSKKHIKDALRFRGGGQGEFSPAENKSEETF